MADSREVKILVVGSPRVLAENVVRVLARKVDQEERPSYIENVAHRFEDRDYQIELTLAPDAYLTVKDIPSFFFKSANIILVAFDRCNEESCRDHATMRDHAMQYSQENTVFVPVAFCAPKAAGRRT